MHSMRELEDSRYNKVAKLANTMKYHPHGDASNYRCNGANWHKRIAH